MNNSLIPSLIEPQYVTTIIAKIKLPSASHFDLSKNDDSVVGYANFTETSDIAGARIYLQFEKRLVSLKGLINYVKF